jgi:hypothetical protein
VDARPPGWVSLFPMVAMDFYGSRVATSAAASFAPDSSRDQTNI